MFRTERAGRFLFGRVQSALVRWSTSIVSVKSLGGFYSKIDLGIVKYHFEVGSGKKVL